MVTWPPNSQPEPTAEDYDVIFWEISGNARVSKGDKYRDSDGVLRTVARVHGDRVYVTGQKKIERLSAGIRRRVYQYKAKEESDFETSSEAVIEPPDPQALPDGAATAAS